MAADSNAPDSVRNGFKAFGSKTPPHIFHASGTCGGTVEIINGEGKGGKNGNRVVQLLNSRGGGLYMQTENEFGVGDCKSDAPGKRRTKSFAAGTADASKRTFMKLGNPDGTMVSFDSGGGQKPTILIATGDGQNGILITDGFVALYSKGTELIVHGNAGKITSTYHLIQETNKGGGKTLVQTYGYHSA